jgi:hypothetical protein
MNLHKNLQVFSFNKEMFVTLVTEVSLISREPKLRFERIESLYLEDFSENRSVLFPSALDTPALKWRPIWLNWRD